MDIKYGVSYKFLANKSSFFLNILHKTKEFIFLYISTGKYFISNKTTELNS